MSLAMPPSQADQLGQPAPKIERRFETGRVPETERDVTATWPPPPQSPRGFELACMTGRSTDGRRLVNDRRCGVYGAIEAIGSAARWSDLDAFAMAVNRGASLAVGRSSVLGTITGAVSMGVPLNAPSGPRDDNQPSKGDLAR